MSSMREIAEQIVAEGTDATGYVFPARMASAITQALRDERERCAKIAETPYGDEVQAFAGDEPLAVGQKIAAVIRKED